MWNFLNIKTLAVMSLSTIKSRLRGKMPNDYTSVDIKPVVKRTRRAHLTIEDEKVVKVEVKVEPNKRIKEEIQKISTEETNKSESWTPANFNAIYDNIKTMRTWVEAPVDTMEGNTAEIPKGPNERFLVLFSLMISSRTKDTLNISKMKELKAKGLSLQYVLNKSVDELAQEIKPVNYYNNKAKFIKKTAEILAEKFNGDVPKTIEELKSLPGVGPKMSYLCLQSAWNITAGIGVDTHVHRLSNLFKWVRKPTKDPEDTRKDLQSWLPIELWDEFNHHLVGFGQTICSPYKPKCEECLNNKICPGAFKFRTKKSKESP